MRTVILFLLLPTLTFAQTNVSGFISTNTTWTLTSSPYIVTGNALVSAGYTLTIEPGVVVKFNTDKALQIDGELIAVGTPQNRITFTSNQSSPAPGDWAKIHFPNTCVDATIDIHGNFISGSIMKYCDVLYGGGLGFGSIHIEDSSPYFNNCKVLNSESAGIYAHVTSSWIDSSSFKGCKDYGLYMDRIEANISDVCFRGNVIENNSGGGINIGPNGGVHYLRISNNYFTSNQGFGTLVLSDVSHRNVIIEENTFLSNSCANVIQGNYLTNHFISCNKFINNSGKTLNMEGGYYNEGTISGNLFEGNNSPTNIIHIQNYYAFYPTYFFNNIIRNNTAQNCLKIIPNIGNTLFTQISNNDFSNNTVINTIYIQPEVASSGSIDFLYIKHNNFLNPLTRYEIYNSIDYGSANIYIDSNYWGGPNTSHIDSVIYDYFDYANQSVVYYLPLRTKFVLIDTTCSPVVLPTGTEEIELLSESIEAKIYPNPFSNQLTFSVSVNEETTVALYNFLGQEILQQTFTNSTTINTEQLADGIYYYELRNDTGTLKTGKVIKH